MPSVLFYTCENCALEHEVTVKDFNFGPLHASFAEHQQHTREFHCNACQFRITIPKDISVDAWNQWKAEDRRFAANLATYPFIADLVTRIDHALETSEPVLDRIETIHCPYCHAVLASGGGFLLVEPCDRCHAQSWKYTGGGIATMRFGVVWPPLPGSPKSKPGS